MGNSLVSSATSAPAAAALPEDIPHLIDGRFEVQHELSPTCHARRCRGRDIATGRPVIIRLTRINSLPAGTLMRLEHEVQLRYSLRSAHNAELLYSGRVGQHFVIVREYVA
ncbi:MAG: hypothetical protein KF861_18695, partial [Planctomycetaceae bacterium]|nr:hypothetical protein [Planctomycetaceae bacterium]